MTCLVGASGGSPESLGKCFSWRSTFNGTSGGTSVTASDLPPDPGSGTGGITVTSVNDTSDFQGIAVTSVNGLPVGGAPPTATQILIAGNSCDGEFTGTFNGNITVSAGQNCTFANGTINGNITVKGGSLALFEVAVDGNVQIQGGNGFTIASYARIDGNLQVQNLPATGTPNYVCDAFVNGNLQVHISGADVQIGSFSTALCGGDGIDGNVRADNNSGAISVVANTVSGNLQLNNNGAATAVFNNTANGNLQCQHNSSISGGGNSAAKKQEQCAGF
ncbi:MAG TPA: hypothetical protein VMU16_11800 [Candidatus Binataceae bacterium]|nr:hypothetical protein [Candidatus Binataceae bacterium]